jgi:hypothetical protein
VTNTAAIASTATWYWWRTTDKSQNVEIVAQSALDAQALEDALDRLTLMTQETAHENARAVVVPDHESGLNMELPQASSRASKALQFDSAGLPSMVTPTDASGTSVTATGSTASRSLAERFAEVYNVKDWGAAGNGVANDTSSIQAAIDAASSAGGGKVFLPSGTYLVGLAGTHSGGQPYGIKLKSNVGLYGSGVYASIIKAAASADMHVLTDELDATNTNITLDGFQIDGNQSNRTQHPNGHFNLWMKGSTDVTIGDLFSKDATSFGFRFETVERMTFNSLKSYIVGSGPGNDGVHFYDCSYVTGASIYASSGGDDAVAITAQGANTHDITISSIVADQKDAGNRGVLLNLGDTAEAASQQYEIYNISLPSIVTSGCTGPALLMQYAQFRNVNCSVVDEGGKGGFFYTVGSSNVTGYMKNCSIKVISDDATENGVLGVITDGVTENCRLDAVVRNPGDNKAGISLVGNGWTGSLKVDYDPAGTKSSPQPSIDIFGDDSRLMVDVEGGLDNVQFRAGADDNTLYLGKLTGATTNAIDIFATATDNTFIGGTVDGQTVVDLGTRTSFVGVRGATDLLKIADDAGAPATVTGQAQIYVDSDGDLKVKFGNGFVAVLAADS